MRRVRCGAWLGGVVLAGGLAAAAQAADPDYSDLWWNAAESGWGMQLVRGGDVMFATLYVYDASARPTFFTATLSNSGSAWSGTLYETTGPFYAAPAFDPAHVVLRIAGTLEFTPATLTSAHVQYAVDGAAVAKDVTRQTLRLTNFSGTYPVTTQRITTHCPDASANGDRIAQETLAIAHDGDVIAVDWTSAQRTCRYTGAYMQSGRLGAAQSSYSCSDGESGDFAFFELTRQDGFVAGRFQGHGVSNGCDYRGRFSGFLPD